MELLTEQLRAAAADPPPSRIDLEALVAGERRRRHRITVGGAAAAVLALAVAVPLLLGYREPPVTGIAVAASSSSPTASQDPAERLTEILAAKLHAMLPGAVLTDPWFVGPPGAHKAAVDVLDGAGKGHIFVAVLAAQGQDCAGVEPGVRCEVRPDGRTIVVAVRDTNGEISYEVQVSRGETVVHLSSSNFEMDPSVDIMRYKEGPPPPMLVTRPLPPLTADQLVEIGVALLDTA
jgi:hypothetical protein